MKHKSPQRLAAENSKLGSLPDKNNAEGKSSSGNTYLFRARCYLLDLCRMILRGGGRVYLP